jgi:signal transduction histidine kinase
LTVWAICSHKVFDARQVVRSIGQRALFLCILGGGAAALVIGVEGHIKHPVDVLLAALVSALLAIVCERPTRRWFGLDPEHLLARPRRIVIEHARHEPDAENLKLRFEKTLKEWCRADQIDLLFAHEGKFVGARATLSSDGLVLPSLVRNSWLTPESLQRKRSDSSTGECARWMAENKCGALLAVPRGSDRPSLIVALGLRESLRPYTYPDIQLLFSLAELMDNILTHASLAQHAAKLAQMESAAMISRSLAHDLRNLTTPIAAYLLHVEGRIDPGGREAEVYAAARHSLNVMDGYIRESLFFSRQLVPEFKELDPRAALLSVIKSSRDRAAEKNVELFLDCAEEVRLSADPALFERLALNLVHNAIDASTHGGLVRISSGKRHERVFVRVEDHGVGIPPENIRHVFDPYFTTKNTGDTRRGLGLGLAICRKIADLHNGDIEVDSIPGQRTVFTALFPVRQFATAAGHMQGGNATGSTPTGGAGLTSATFDGTRTSI